MILNTHKDKKNQNKSNTCGVNFTNFYTCGYFKIYYTWSYLVSSDSFSDQLFDTISDSKTAYINW